MEREDGLRADGVRLGYGEASVVVDALDLRVDPGSFTVIVGPNACGKSTLLKALARVLDPAGGAVVLDGRDAASIAPKQFARRVGFLPQSATAPEGITVAELVSRGRYPHQSLLRQWSSADDRAVREAMARTAVADLADRPVGALSGGQRQRVWIAMALAQQTDILLLDEPTTFLDLSHQIEVLELCLELNLQAATTIVAVLHDVNQACRYADRIVAMRDGAIVAQGAPADVVTADLVHRVFSLEAQVVSDPVSGTPLVVPLHGGRHAHAR